MKLSEMQKGFQLAWNGVDLPKIIAGKKAGPEFRKQLRTKFSHGHETFNGVLICDDESLPDNVVRFVSIGDGAHSGETYDVVIEEEKDASIEDGI
jgi:hypothetical protein